MLSNSIEIHHVASDPLRSQGRLLSRAKGDGSPPHSQCQPVLPTVTGRTTKSCSRSPIRYSTILYSLKLPDRHPLLTMLPLPAILPLFSPLWAQASPTSRPI